MVKIAAGRTSPQTPARWGVLLAQHTVTETAGMLIIRRRPRQVKHLEPIPSWLINQRHNRLPGPHRSSASVRRFLALHLTCFSAGTADYRV